MVNKYKGMKSGVGKPCVYCCRRMAKADSDEAFDDPGLIVSIEHKIYPKSKGGTNDAFNLAHACRRCNNLRGNIAIELFEPFARTVIQQYPDALDGVLRDALKAYIYHLATLSINNNRGIKNAALATLVEIRHKTKDRSTNVYL